eukprot:751499-Hanusia_phi.AAC.4
MPSVSMTIALCSSLYAIQAPAVHEVCESEVPNTCTSALACRMYQVANHHLQSVKETVVQRVRLAVSRIAEHRDDLQPRSAAAAGYVREVRP